MDSVVGLLVFEEVFCLSKKLSIYEGNTLGIGAMCGLGGFTILSLLPCFTLPAYGLIAIGGACVAEYIQHWSEFDQIFKSLKLGSEDAYPIQKRKSKKDGYILYEFTLPAGLSTEDFVKKQLEIEQHLGKPIEIEYGMKNLLIKVYPRNERTLYEYEPVKLKGNMPILIGYDRTGQLVTADLSSGEPHMYVAGETGSGKSTALRAMLVNLILHNDIDLYLADLKNGVEFNMFKRCQKVVEFARTEEETLTMLENIQKEADRRYKLFADADCEGIKSYNKHHKKLKYQLLVVDEFATLMYEKESIALLEQLSAKARACGIHILLSTQRPDAKVITGRIKNNISNVLGLKTLDKTNSGIIIGHDGLERLRGQGHGIFKRGMQETTIQAPLLSTDDAKKLIKPYNIIKTKEEKPKELTSFDFLEVLK